MELFLINSEKLKVTLSSEDMSYYSLTSESIDYHNTETRRAFWSILDEAKHQTGFDAASERVLVQVFPLRSGGCEMFVTKVHSPTHTDTPISLVKARRSDGEYYFRFQNLTLLLKACRASKNHTDIKSSAYTDGEFFYLQISPSEEGENFFPTEFPHILCEFASPISAAEFAIAGERCTLIAEDDAIKRLCRFI